MIPRLMFTGTHTALVTPFTKGGKVDEPRLRQIVEQQIAAGVDGLGEARSRPVARRAVGPLGELLQLRELERRRLVRPRAVLAVLLCPVQRAVGEPDQLVAAAARRAYLNTSLAIGGTFFLLGVVGAAVVGFYRAFPGGLPEGMTVAKNGDICFPFYISHYLSPGVSGLVVAGMLAGSMSGLCAGINSVITVISVIGVLNLVPEDGEPQ